MALSQDIKERIFAAADALHAASETSDFPSVEAVRQESRAGMNNVVEAMKEWRQKQRKQVQAVREPLPSELNGVVQSMGQSLWETAQQLANESLDAAKVAFETEKSDLIQLSAEQSEAYEKQAGELETANVRIAELERQAEAAASAAQATAQQLEDVRRALLAAEQKKSIAEQKAEEVERRAADLRAELDHAHAETDRLRIERDKAQEHAEAASSLHNSEVARLTGDFSRQLAEHVAALQAAQADAGRLRSQLSDAGEKLDAASVRERAKIEESAMAKADAARLADQLKDQKARSLEVIGKLEKAKQSLDAEIAALQKEARTLVAQGGRAAGELDALRAQVEAQNGVIKGFSSVSDKKTK
ncbi:DNA-binding protein [Sulfuriferula sp.]|uniref:DNA-binding protein n=1 Tax=Sulfuriferula sp. TaxID=2025307 RepID=UPI00273043C0|nr:DNA-binding protein [Sulfuriferula sp.]MDP2027499.1 DNA-binding protein [Sulfuriferula sp.]